MKTAGYFTYFGPGRIGITRGTPRGLTGYSMYRRLAPGAWFRSHHARGFAARYRAEVLDVLDPRATWDELHDLADGAEPVLLCFERPPYSPTNWCHRHLVAEWLGLTLGEDVQEIGHDRPELEEVLGFNPWA